MLGCSFKWHDKVIDSSTKIFHEAYLDINNMPINSSSCNYLNVMIHAGIFATNTINSSARSQKIPTFFATSLPHNKIASQVSHQASLFVFKDIQDIQDIHKENFTIVFGAMEVNMETVRFFCSDFEESGEMQRVALFLNPANDPMIKRIVTSRLALTKAEYLVYKQSLHMLVILTDTSLYADALSEVSAAREEVPGKRGYPGYMSTDLSTIY